VPLIEIAKRIGSTEQSVRRFLRAECKDIWVEGASRKGVRAPGYKGGRVVHRGYVYLLADRDDPIAMKMASASGYVLEHRLVLAHKLGRALSPKETVHHINGDPNDNRPENLQLRQGRHGKHVAMCCHDCGSRNVGPAPLEEH